MASTQTATSTQTLLPLDQTPSWNYQEGIVNDYNVTNINGTVLIVAIVIFIVLTLFCTGARVYAKKFLTHSMGWDDCEHLS